MTSGTAPCESPCPCFSKPRAWQLSLYNRVVEFGPDLHRAACERRIGTHVGTVRRPRRLRLEHACRLLEETRAPLKVVAHRAGLGDSSTLYRLFMRQFRVSPAAYRERFAHQA